MAGLSLFFIFLFQLQMRPDGSIPIELLATFNRIQKLTNDYNVILEVTTTSWLLLLIRLIL